MRRAAALVTDGGGMTCHAAIVRRELGVPCVVGARNATTVLRDGEIVTVDGAAGRSSRGRRRRRQRRRRVARRPSAARAAGARDAARHPALRQPGLRRARRGGRGACTSTASACCAPSSWSTDALGGVHPRLLIERGEQKTFVDKMAASLLRITRAFAPRPVVYRSIDFRTNEFRSLEGGERFEPHEENPMIGYRGCYRYVREPELFRLELDVLARVREETPNLHADDPVRAHRAGSSRPAWTSSTPARAAGALPVWVMAEVPSVAYWIPDLRRAWASTGVSIGSNDLTQLMLGVDRDSESAPSCSTRPTRAVLDAIGRIIAGLPRRGDHLVAVRPGAVEPARVRRAPGAARASPRSRSTPTPSTPSRQTVARRRVAAPARGGRRRTGPRCRAVWRPRHSFGHRR